ncbi:MAG: ATP-dependent helicase [Deltaproteobacteria bacterium]|nr:ATP-dependent helicase [Deltaproteobacteria bacterium]
MAHIREMTNTEHHFRVFAGPGAGKTHWLAQHLKKVLRESNQLGKTRKIAAITYTNVAAKELSERLGVDSYRVDVSTIHSFLYRYVIQPFKFLLQDETDSGLYLDCEKLSGHSEHFVRQDRLRSWIAWLEVQRGKSLDYLNYPKNKKALLNKLVTLEWQLVGDSCRLVFDPQKKYLKIPIVFTPEELIEYKKGYWRYGILHHEDVLFFAHYLLANHPEVLQFVRKRFAYIFVDEFQDTTQLQTWIIKKIADASTVVGVIGDIAQSIYLFTGAQKKDFESFTLEGIKDYKIDDNHRSVEQIVKFLNTLRDDIQQESRRDPFENAATQILVGDTTSALRWIEDQGFPTPTILARNNSQVNAIRHGIANQPSGDNLIKALYAVDSDRTRPAFLHSLLLARDFSIKNENKNAVAEVVKYLKKDKGGHRLNYPPMTFRRIAIGIIRELQSADFLDKTLYEYYTSISKRLADEQNIKIGAGYRAGNVKRFADSHKFGDLLPFIRTDTSAKERIRTIHSAKGTQFDSVMLVVTEEEFEKWIRNGKNAIDNDADDSARIYYVGLSRAKNHLFVNIADCVDGIIAEHPFLAIQYLKA